MACATREQAPRRGQPGEITVEAVREMAGIRTLSEIRPTAGQPRQCTRSQRGGLARDRLTGLGAALAQDRAGQNTITPRAFLPDSRSANACGASSIL
jgi:hypothetical protein